VSAAQFATAISLYAAALTLWVIAERWRLARITDSPIHSIIGVLFTLCLSAQALCFAVSASVVLNWKG
jgi:hypothetical protein